MAVDKEQLRAALLEFLSTRAGGSLDFAGGNRILADFCRLKGLQLGVEDSSKLMFLFHEFYLERLIVPGNQSPGLVGGHMDWPWYFVTEYGKSVLSSREYQPYDPTGFLKRLGSEIPTIDSIIVRYLEEALGCLRADHLLSAAVMTGCAAEKAMLLLVEEYGDSIKVPADKAAYEKETSAWMISKKYAALWKRLEPQAKSLPGNLGDDLHAILDRVFDLIRTTRNEAGHPTGKKIERETVSANLILFPVYCRRIYKLLEHFK